MPYCKKMKRPCTCGRLLVYDRNGRLPEQNNIIACLTDSEARSALAVLFREREVRFGGTESTAAPLYA
ncbi:MAG TPA: hypothetical protein VJS85_02265 [Rhizomicrobium sp.]|nr:hypothetical protein [Rhizomicrobium sp.]